MALTTGRRLGPYEILSPLGAGGMGEVYKARDTRLDRTVAIKILPDSLSGDPQFRERFDREARVISQLDHPHICALYDVGQEDGTAYLVMQYLEGETLAEKLTRGPIRLDEALAYATQIADALARAHRAGIVHRDLKPGNVIVTKSGAKLLDFGLAKAAAAVVPSGASLVTTPAALTMQGSILGTFQYMAPEQIEGADADARADIWAFGCVLYEMITGARAFAGKSYASLIANILQSQPPPIRQVQPLASSALDHIVQRCFEKDPEMRWQSIADVGRELRWVSTAEHDVSRPTPAHGRGWRLIGVAAALLLTVSVIAAFVLRPAAAIPAGPQTKLTLLPPDNLAFTPFGSSATPHFALSPDGTQIAFVASEPGRAPSLWVRPLASRVPRELPGTEDAATPFWSSNGQSIGFFAQGYLRTIAVNGERPTTLVRVTDPAGGAWYGDVILIGHGRGPLGRIAATGGAATDATHPGSAAVGHQWPQFLPDGRHYIFMERGRSVRLGVLDSTSTTEVLNYSGTAVYADTGHLLFVEPPTFIDRQRLMAQALDRSWTPVGAARQIMDDVRSAPGFGFPPVSIAANGLLAYWDGTTISTVWGWVDAQGHSLPAAPAPPGGAVSLARTDGRMAYTQSEGSVSAVWLMEPTGRPSRLTFAGGGASTPVWSSDGREILFTSMVDGVTTVFRQPTGGLERERLIAKLPGSEGLPAGNFRLMDWSRDGRYALVTSATKPDITLVSVDTGQVAPLIHTAATEVQPRFSPDGRWIAYVSDESGRWEVFVEPFPVSGARSQVSTTGGSQPIWRDNGAELYFLAPDGKLMSAAVRTGTTFSSETPRPLFQTRMRPTYAPYPVDYDVAPDGQRFLIRGARPDTGPVISIVANWRELLTQKQ